MDADTNLRRRGWQVSPSGCWVTNVGKDSDGYGVIWHQKQHRRVHRLAYETWVGPIPEGSVVRHACDNPPCINPEHLLLGTHADNVRDMDERGRRVGNRKLTAELASEIRTQYAAAGGVTKVALARQYGVTDVTIGHIVRGKTWS